MFCRKPITIILLHLTSLNLLAQTQASDSIAKNVTLNEVTVTASNIVRVDDHLQIRPNEQQRRHASTGYELLENIMLPGVIVNTRSGKVEAMGMAATLYLNGQVCDAQDIRMLRPRDIEKIEYHDIPSGKYAKDKIAINFITKQYKYGGYVQMDAMQRGCIISQY